MVGRADPSLDETNDKLLAPRDVRQGGTWTRGQRLKNDLIFGLVRLSVALAITLPRTFVRRACRLLGRTLHLLWRKGRRDVQARLRAGLGESASIQTLCRQTFLTMADMLALLRVDERASAGLTLDPSSKRVLAEALAEGRGVVFVSAHLGSWERMAALLVEEGFPLATVARESYDPRLTDIYERIRRPRGVRSLYRGRSGVAMAIARELVGGRVVGFLVDLPSRVPSISHILFGAEVSVPVGPARIALARRAAVVVGTCSRPASGGARGLPSVWLSRVSIEDLADKQDAELALVTRISEEIGRRIATWPEAWLGAFMPP